MKHMKSLTIILLVGLFAAACAPGAAPGSGNTVNTPTSAANPTQPPAKGSQSIVPPAAAAVLPALAKSLGMSTDQLVFRSAQEVMWPDSCLGVHMKNEMCSMVVTPGYNLLYEANGQTIEVHTNQSGSSFRVANSGVKGAPQEGSSSTSPSAVKAAIKLLAQQLGISESNIAIVKMEKVDWPNGCLGVQMPGRVCTQTITPGYRILLAAGEKQYEFHTDEAGGAVYPAVAPLPETADKVVVWQQTEAGACTRAEIGAKGIAYGTCGASLKQAQLQPARLAELAYLYAAYQKFDNSLTKAGTVSLASVGQQMPTQAEMRSIAEWASLVAAEVQGEAASGAAEGILLHWHREGGIAGFCDDLTIYRSGWAAASSCKTGQAQPLSNYRLSADELAKAYQWLDDLKQFDYNTKDAASTDSMIVSLSFKGAGSAASSADTQQQIGQFASQVYIQALK